MPRPNINTTIEELRGQSARGLAHGAAPGSSGNIMPGPNMRPMGAASGGATAGLGANPSRTGNPNPIAGGYQQIKGSPVPDAPLTPTPQSVRTHSLALGGMKHMVAAGHLQPHHAKAMEKKSRAHIAAYKNMSKPTPMPAPRKFGALGGGGGGAGPAMKPDLDQDGW